MTLLLTCTTGDFVVQASDRRLTWPGPRIAEEASNKATLLENLATFAYTGPSRIRHDAPTADWITHQLARQVGDNLTERLEALRQRATDDLRTYSARYPPGSFDARLSIVGGGFASRATSPPTSLQEWSDSLGPFLAVISNAQSLDSKWMAAPSVEFQFHFGWTRPDVPSLRISGQNLTAAEEISLRRHLGRAWPRSRSPAPVARLLARWIRIVADHNGYVGKNVMCTIVRRPSQPMGAQVSVSSGMVPLADPYLDEISYFRMPAAADDAAYIFSPGERGRQVYYGPNFATMDGIEMLGARFGPDELASE